MVKELRQRTGAGMMQCKKSLTEADGDMERAVELLRKAGQAQADNKSARVAAEGLISVAVADDQSAALLLEVNCETDFVAKEESFKSFCNDVAQAALEANPADGDALAEVRIGTETIDELRKNMVIKTGENICLRRFVRIPLNGNVHAVYIHNTRIGVIADLQGGDEELAKNIALHIAASRPLFLSQDDVPAEVLDREKSFLIEQAIAEDKPADIVEKMVQGRLKKYIKEITLVGQAFVKDPDTTVGQLLQKASASVNSFHRYEIGEGIEKKKRKFCRRSHGSDSMTSKPVALKAESKPSQIAKQRVILKLSGEILMGEKKYGIDIDAVERLVAEIKQAHERKIEIAIVIGGGNIFRGRDSARAYIDSVTADQMGMLATVINALAMQEALERSGLQTRVMSAIEINAVCERYIRRRAMHHLEKGLITIFAAGTGNPFFTTDTAASLRAVEINATLLLKATKVDGVYDKDPEHNPDATMYASLSYDQVIKKKLEAMDTTAIVLCRDNGIPIRVFNMHRVGAFGAILRNEECGTLISNEA